MPVHAGLDRTGPYYQWGQHGKKYYFQLGHLADARRAYHLAETQGRAIKSRQHK